MHGRCNLCCCQYTFAIVHTSPIIWLLIIAINCVMHARSCRRRLCIRYKKTLTTSVRLSVSLSVCLLFCLTVALCPILRHRLRIDTSYVKFCEWFSIFTEPQFELWKCSWVLFFSAVGVRSKLWCTSYACCITDSQYITWQSRVGSRKQLLGVQSPSPRQ